VLLVEEVHLHVHPAVAAHAAARTAVATVAAVLAANASRLPPDRRWLLRDRERLVR
jgi:hypothetical protein